MFFYNICSYILHKVINSTCRGYMYSSFFFLCRNSPDRVEAAFFFEVSRSQPITHTYTHARTHARSDSSERVIRTSQGPVLTQHTQETYIHPLGGIRTRNPSKLATVDLGLTPGGHWIYYLCIEFPLNLRQHEFHFQMDALYCSARIYVVKKLYKCSS
jgi:hypothetical protein